jgi:hypothetical protein
VNKTVGACLAASVAAIFSAGCEKRGNSPGQSAEGRDPHATALGDMNAASAGSPSLDENVQCLGIHECKGKSACHVAGAHGCAGQNACKGKGWISVPRAECDAKGGTINHS